MEMNFLAVGDPGYLQDLTGPQLKDDRDPGPYGSLGGLQVSKTGPTGLYQELINMPSAT